MSVIIFGLTFLSSGQAYGQLIRDLRLINVDSLSGVMNELAGTKKVDALNKMALGLCYKFPDSCISMARQTIRFSQSIGYEKGEATGYFNLGNGYFFLDSLKNSVVNYLTALRIFENIDVCMEMGYTLEILSLLNWRAGKMETAIQQEKKQVQIARQLSDPHYEIDVLIKMGSHFSLIREFDSTDFYLDKAITLLKKYPDTIQLSRVILFKGYNTLRKHDAMYFRGIKEIPDNNLPADIIRQDIYWHPEEIDFGPEVKKSLNYLLKESIQWNLKHVELEEEFDFTQNVIYPYYAVIYYNLAFAYLRLNTPADTKSGLRYLNKAKNLADSCELLKFQKLFIYRLLGSLASESGDYRAAIKIYKEGIQKAEQVSMNFDIKDYDIINPFRRTTARDFYYKQILSWIYMRIIYAYAKLGDYKKVHEYYVLQEKAKSEIYLEDNKNLITMLEAESENEKIENRIAMLEKEKHLNELKAQQTRNVNIGIIIVFAVLLMMGALFLRQNKLKNDHKNALLEQKLLRLQMNPHFIFNALSNIHSLMSPESVNRASAYLVNFSRLLRSSLESSREDYILLEDEISSLKNYLELQQLRYQSKFEYEIEVDPDIDLESAILPPMLIQPFIENAIEHGIMHKKGPGKVFIRFVRNGNKITCEIEDDGVGREKAWEVEYAKKGKHKSLATEIIRDRIAVLNKKLKQKIHLSISDLKSDDDESPGTRVRLDLPYMLD